MLALLGLFTSRICPSSVERNGGDSGTILSCLLLALVHLQCRAGEFCVRLQWLAARWRLRRQQLAVCCRSYVEQSNKLLDRILVRVSDGCWLYLYVKALLKQLVRQSAVARSVCAVAHCFGPAVGPLRVGRDAVIAAVVGQQAGASRRH